MDELNNKYIFGHLDIYSRSRYWLGIVLALLLFGTIGMMILSPWDPQGAICLQFVDGEAFFLLRLLGLLLVTGVCATIIMDGRLPLFGVMAAGVGIGLPIVKTAGMSYVMVRLQVGKEFEHAEALWAYMLLESLTWSVLLLILIAATMATENWIRKDKCCVLKMSWGKGLAGTAITVVATLLLVSLFAASGDKGQVIFAVIASYYVAALVADQITENDHPIWQVLACPIVAVIAYAYTWHNPDRTPGLESLINIAPTHLGWVLPVEYIFIGAVGAIFGTWTSIKMRYNKAHG